MESILEEMYFVLIEEGLTIKGKSPKTVLKSENSLCKRLKGKEKKLFSDYEMAYSEYAHLCAVEGFKHGFKAGCNVVQELLNL